MGNFRRVTHVLFDLDGLIIASLMDVYSLTPRWVNLLRILPCLCQDSEKVYKKIFGSIIEGFGKKYIDEVRLAVLGTREGDVARMIVDRLQLPIAPEEFAKLAKSEYKKYLSSVELKPGAEKLIKHFYNNNVPLALATSSSEESFKIKTANYISLFSNFHHVVKGAEVANGKPAPDIFLQAANRFSNNPPKPEDCLVFEDAPNGVRAAIAAGMQVVMVPEDYVPKELTQNATLTLKSLLDFKPELFGLPPFPEQQ